MVTDQSMSTTGVFARCSARRLLVMGGILLILIGMLLGDIFAVFVLHQNASRINEDLLAAVKAITIHDTAAVPTHFRNIGGFLENRGTKVDAHVHMIDFGYLALLLAIVQPYVRLREAIKKKLAWVFLAGAFLLPVGVFLIHYVGLFRSPLQSIGWASIFADFGGALVLVVAVIELIGLWPARGARESSKPADPLFADRSSPAQTLLHWGTVLVLLGFLQGAGYAAVHLFQDEVDEAAILSRMSERAARKDTASAAQAVQDYAQLQGRKAVIIAAHAHEIEFGMLAILMAFFQPLVFLSDKWKTIWARVLLLGSFVLPIFVLLELHLGLVAGGFADIGGLLVIAALAAMLAGIVRYTGSLDAAEAGTA